MSIEANVTTVPGRYPFVKNGIVPYTQPSMTTCIPTSEAVSLRYFNNTQRFRGLTGTATMDQLINDLRGRMRGNGMVYIANAVTGLASYLNDSGHARNFNITIKGNWTHNGTHWRLYVDGDGAEEMWIRAPANIQTVRVHNVDVRVRPTLPANFFNEYRQELRACEDILICYNYTNATDPTQTFKHCVIGYGVNDTARNANGNWDVGVADPGVPIGGVNVQGRIEDTEMTDDGRIGVDINGDRSIANDEWARIEVMIALSPT